MDNPFVIPAIMTGGRTNEIWNFQHYAPRVGQFLPWQQYKVGAVRLKVANKSQVCLDECHKVRTIAGVSC
mgnify:FL=1